jgi:uncharacterized protein (TIGR03437 family)
VPSTCLAIGAGSTSGTFTATAGQFASDQTASVTATLNDSSKTAALSLTAPVLVAALLCGAPSLASNTGTTCTITLSKPVPAGATASISVSSDNTALTVPTSALTVAGGSSSVAFTAHAGTFSSSPTAKVTATLNGVSKSVQISLSIPSLSWLACTPLNVMPGGSGSCSVKLSIPSAAPSTVVLKASTLALSVPSTVTIASGAATATFSYTTSKIITGQVTLTAAFGGVAMSAAINVIAAVEAPRISSAGTAISDGAIAPIGLSCDDTFLVAGRPVGCEIQLSAPSVAESMEVAIASSTSSLMVPATVTARAGQSHIRFEIGAGQAASPETAILEARLGSMSIQRSIVVVPSDTPELTVPTELAGTPQTPIRFRVTAGDARGFGVNLAAAGLPTGATFDPKSGVLQWAPTDKDLGVYEIAFTATNMLGAVTTKTMKLYVDSGLPVVTSLENGAGSSAPAGCSAGSLAALRGRFLFAGTEPASDSSGASADLGGTRVLVNGVYAPVLYASADRVYLLCPRVAAGTRMAIAVETAAGQSNELDIRMQAGVPGLFTADGSGTGQALAVRSGWLDLAAIPSARWNGNPALPGDMLSFLATGIDCSEPAVADLSLQLSLQLGPDLIPVTALQPMAGHAGTCQILAPVPPGVIGDAVGARLQLAGSDGRRITSNETTISVAARR